MPLTARWGVLGTGLIASVFVQDVKLLDDAEVVAVASHRAGGAHGFAAKYGVPTAYDSYQALVADPDIDLVYVAVPHSRHFASALLAIRAGKNVLVEKPFTINAGEAEVLATEAGKHAVFLMEAMWARFLPHMVELRRMVDAGELGEIVTVLSDHGLRFDPEHPEHRLYDPELGGGALLDLGVYSAGFVTGFLGDQLEIKALGTPTATGVDASLSAIIRDEHGRHGVMTTSLSTELSNRACVAGTKGRVEIGYQFMGPSDLTIYRFGETNPAKGDTVETFTAEVSGHGIRFEAAEAARCVREGLKESPVMPLTLTLKVMRVMDEMRRQAGVSYASDELNLQQLEEGS